MVKTGGPRGHGPGRAKTPEAEEARRAKIRTAVLLRKKQVRVRITADYRLKGRSMDERRGRQRTALADWNYKNDREYFTRVPFEMAYDRRALEAFLNERYPRRIHYRIRSERISG